MREILAANLRFHGRRYLATGVAVAIATAFIVMCLGMMSGLGASLRQSIAGTYEGAVAEVRVEDPNGPTEPVTDEAPDPERPLSADPTNVWAVKESILSTPGVSAVHVVQPSNARFSSDSNEYFGSYEAARSAPLTPVELSEGNAPVNTGEVALDARIAKQLAVEPGDTILLDPAQGAEGASAEKFLVTGLYGDADALMSMSETASAIVPASVFEALNPDLYAQSVLVVGEGAPTEEEQRQVVSALQAELSEWPQFSVVTGDEAAEQAMERASLGQGSLTAVLMVFPVIAAAVALMVIGTTFSVLLHQRQRELALLRCLGASSAQVRRVIVGESLIVGAVGSAIGVVVGAFAGPGLVVLLGASSSYSQVIGSINWLFVALVWVGATVATMIAGSRPAARAAKVAPLEALHPAELQASAGRKGRWVRGTIGVLLAAAAGGFAFVKARGEGGDGDFLLIVALCLVATVGLVLLLSAVLPSLTRVVGSLVRTPVGEMAAGNTARNPGRTASTGISIFVGVTLITMMMVGASSLKATVADTLDGELPFDLYVAGDPELTASEVEDLASVAGVDQISGVRMATASVTFPGESATEVDVVDTEALSSVSRAEVLELADGEVMVNSLLGIDGETVQVCPSEGECWEAIARGGDMVGQSTLGFNSASFGEAFPDAGISMVVIRLQDPANYAQVSSDIKKIDESFQPDGAAKTRAEMDQILDTILAIVVGLLAVSVLVAIVGVANTLSLSVAERIRENGLLRALGMTKRQISSMLTVEAGLIAGVAALIGLGAGIFFGIVGINALPMELTRVLVVIPWGQVALVFAVALAAAVVASLIPGRRAASVSPVVALASE